MRVAGRLYCLLPFFLFSTVVSAQQFGGNNPSIKWRQINSKTARVIFPSGNDSTAERIADIVKLLDTSVQSSIGYKKKKINIILQERTTISNAYVALGPFRSEFFMTPVQNSFDHGSIPWPDQLASHEFRHVQQYNNFNVGLSHIAGALFGQQARALANDAVIPNWFFEGDAVFNETKVSRQGRGRLPYFFKDYVSLWQAGRNYSWMKLRNGSLKDFTPDHYVLGYLLVAYGYEKYGNDFWKKVTHDAAAFKGLLYPFQAAIKKYSGVPFVKFRADALNYFKKQFEDLYQAKGNNSGRYVNSQYPAFLNDSTLIFVESSFSKTPRFIISTANKERKLRNKDLSLDDYFSYNNGKIVYTSYRPDIRWGNEDYSNIELLDVQSGNQKTLTRKGKYFSPDIDNVAGKIVAVKASGQGNAVLELMDINGNIIKTLPNINGYFYTYPKFVDQNHIVSAVRNKDGEMALMISGIDDGNEKLITPFSYNTIGFPAVNNQNIYFTATIGKRDELFRYNITDQSLSIAETEEIGAYQPNATVNSFAYIYFTDKGFKIKKSSATTVSWKSITKEVWLRQPSDFNLSVLNQPLQINNKIPHGNYVVTDYKKSHGLFNFHSIVPDINDPVYTFNLIGENLLNTFRSQISFTYDRNEGYKKLGYSFTYAGIFPLLSAGVNYSFDRQALIQNKLFYFSEKEIFTGIALPFNLSKGRSETFLEVGTRYTLNRTEFPSNITPDHISYSYLEDYISFSSQIQQARQNIYPRLAQALSLKFQHAVTKFSGQQFVANANLYFPGIGRNHNIVVNLTFLQKDTLKQIGFSSGFPFSRGYTSFNFHKMIKYGINYHLPLVYPDFGIANVVYFSRIRANLFYDNTMVYDFYKDRSNYKNNFSSIGTEIFFDTKWWNQSPLTFGIRYSHFNNQDINSIGPDQFEIILPLNIFHY